MIITNNLLYCTLILFHSKIVVNFIILFQIHNTVVKLNKYTFHLLVHYQILMTFEILQKNHKNINQLLFEEQN
jgi:hypothetical protein